MSLIRLNRRVILVDEGEPCRRPLSLPSLGEMRLVDFVRAESEKFGLSKLTIYGRLYHGKYPGLTMRHVNSRLCFVTP